jgi:hypothetical protein
MEVLKLKVNSRGRPPSNPLCSSLRERFQAKQRKVVAEHNAAGHAVVVLDPSDWVLSAVRDERTLEAIARAYTCPVLD